MNLWTALKYPICKQLTPYSCGAAVLQMAVARYKGYKLSHWEAIRITDCYPNGVSMTGLKRAFRACGLKVGHVDKRASAVRKALGVGKTVIVDEVDWAHWRLIAGQAGSHRVVVVDPNPLRQLFCGVMPLHKILQRCEYLFSVE